MASPAIDIATGRAAGGIGLDELARDPECVSAVASDDARRLFTRAIGVLLALSSVLQRDQASRAVPRESRLLRADEVACRIGMSKSWVEKNAGELPPRVRVGGGGRWIESEIDTWIRTRPRWSDP